MKTPSFSFSFWTVLGLTLVFRITTLLVVSADVDEWTYRIMAAEMLNGEILYQDLIDIKPPFVFIYNAIILSAGSFSIIFARAVHLFLISVSAFFIGRLSQKIWTNINPWIVSLIYILLFAYPMGIAMNTEFLFQFFLILAALLRLNSNSWSTIALAGFIGGFAFITKYTTAVDLIMIGTFGFWITPPSSIIKSLKQTILFGSFSLLPFLILHGIYWNVGAFNSFLFAVYELPFSYSAQKSLTVFFNSVGLFHIRFIWIVPLLYVGIFQLFKKQRNRAIGFLVWYFLIWLMIYLQGKLHDHYWLQLAFVVPLISGYALSHQTEFIKKWMAYGIILIGLGFSIYYPIHFHPTDQYLQHIATKTKTIQEKDDVIWVVNLSSALYEMLDNNCPSAYVHPSLTTKKSHVESFHIDVEEEWGKTIIKSDIVIFWNNNTDLSNQLEKRLELKYPHRLLINGDTRIYSR